jgi:hypothetical protein
MSKEAALRAMREANFARGSTRATAAPKPNRPAARPTQTQAADPVDPAPSTDELCGHRSMNGRSCTREQGHPAKSHRYS